MVHFKPARATWISWSSPERQRKVNMEVYLWVWIDCTRLMTRHTLLSVSQNFTNTWKGCKCLNAYKFTNAVIFLVSTIFNFLVCLVLTLVSFVGNKIKVWISKRWFGEGNLIFCCAGSRENYIGLVGRQNNNPKFQRYYFNISYIWNRSHLCTLSFDNVNCTKFLLLMCFIEN